MVYRLTCRNMGGWRDAGDGEETFDFDTEKEAIATLNVIQWRNYKGTPMSFRAVSDEELDAEQRHWANSMACNM